MKIKPDQFDKYVLCFQKRKTVTTNKIQDGQVNVNDLSNSSVTNQKLAADSITTDKILDGNVGTNDIADNAVTRPKLADDAVTVSKIMEDLVHVLWTDNTLGSDVIFYKRDGGGFDPSTGGLIGTTLSSIAVSGNNVHVVSVAGGQVFYTRSINGGASFSLFQFTFGGNSINPSIAVSGNDVHIVWEDIFGNRELFYIRSTNGGASFGPVINLSNSGGLSALPSIAVSGNNVFVIWRDDTSGNNEILYRRSTDGGASFEPIVNLSNNAGSSLFASIAASGNNVYVVWDDNPSGPEILYRRSTDGGASFEPIVNLSNSLSSGVSGASVAVKGDTVYAVWHETSVGGNNEIIYRRSIDGGANFDAIAANLSNNFGNSRDAHIAVSYNE